MQRSTLFVLLGILAVVVIAGCTQRAVTQAPNQGLAITTFEISDSQADSGDIVLLDMEVENIGGTTATNVQADLFGVEGQWRDIFGNTIDTTLTQTIGRLRPPVPSKSIPGDFKLIQWQLQTPDLPQGITRPITIEARVTYDYNTSGHMVVGALSEDEFRRRQILQQDIGPVADIVNSEGPIHLEMQDRYRAPIIIGSETDTAVETHPFRFDVVNVGNGFPITPEADGRVQGAGGKLTGTIEVRGPGVSFEDCLGQRGGTFINLDDSEIIVRLRENGRVPIACTIAIDKTAWGDRPVDTIQFVFNIFYRYYVSSGASVTVVGR